MTFTDAAPQIVHDRTYLPFRAVFAALGFADEKITYDEDRRTVSAVREDVEVSMVIGENRVTVVKDGKTEVLDTDVPAFIAPKVNRTFVPVSFVAQALGYRVAWNGETRTVFIDDVEGILAANSETYQILDRYLDYSREVQKKTYQAEGIVAASMGSSGELLSMEGSYSMLMAGSTKFDLAMQLKLSGITEGVALESALSGGIDLSMRGDMTTGEFYVQSVGLVPQMAAGMENVWFKLDRNAALGSAAESRGMSWMDMLDVSQAAKGINGTKWIQERVAALAQSDPTRSAADQLAMYNALLGDSAYEKKSGSYVNTIEKDGAAMTVVFYRSGSRINGYSVVLSTVEDGASVSVEQVRKESAMRTVYRVQEGDTSTTIELDGTCTVTQKTPAGAPEEGAVVLELTTPLGSTP